MTKVNKDDGIKILITDECLSLSGHTSIFYSIGWDGKNFLLKIDSVSSSAIFNSYFVNVNYIIEIFNDARKPFSSSVLQIIFKRQSVNTACFYTGISKHLKLIVTAPDNGRKFVLGDPKEFLDSVQAMVKPTKRTPKKQSTEE
jgi:hypothetical protein